MGLGPNWEQNMSYTISWQLLCRKMRSMTTGLKVSSLTCKCVFYRPGHNAKERPQLIEFCRSQNAEMKYNELCSNSI